MFGENRWAGICMTHPGVVRPNLILEFRMYRFASLPAWPCLRPLRAALGNRRLKQGGTAYLIDAPGQ